MSAIEITVRQPGQPGLTASKQQIHIF